RRAGYSHAPRGWRLRDGGSCAAVSNGRGSLPDRVRVNHPASAKNLLYCANACDQRINIGAGVIKRKRGPRRRRDVEMIHQRLRSVMADADGYTAVIDDGADIMRMHPFQREGDDCRLMFGLTNDL